MTRPHDQFLVEMPLKVQGYDIDVAGIVSNIVYVRWLEDLRLPARLVRHDGTVRTTAGWPGDREDQPR